MLVFAAHLSYAKQSSAKITLAAPLVIEDLGKGTVPLSGPWQFHVGDNSAWANPAFDSSDWEHISADRSWGEQGHVNFTGFAWYRCTIALTPAFGLPSQFSLLVPKVDDAYEIYWNGTLIGRNGRLQPFPLWYYSQPAQTFELGQVQRGVLAVRVWKAPLFSDDSGTLGGFRTAPLIGSPEAITTAKTALEYQWLRSRQFLFGENLLSALVALLSLLLWLRNRAQRPLFWMTGYALAPPVNLLLVNAHLPWPYVLAMGAVQPLGAIRDISLWFLLLWLLPVRENRTMIRLTRILAGICLVNSVVDGVLIALSWNPQWIVPIRAGDALTAIIFTPLETFPLVLLGYALFQRRQFNLARWLVVISASFDEMIFVVHNAVEQGRQFTHWSFASKMEAPLFTIGGSAISIFALSGTILLVAIVYAVYHSVVEDQRRQEILEREKLELMLESTRMRHHAEHDDLTGLWNHRIIVQRLREELDRARRDGTPISVILIDVDHFKKINDNFGHPTGDLVLKEIGTIFAHSLRAYDCVGRYGGEEFLIILPGCNMKNALIRAEQMRMAVQSAQIMDGETTLQVTASFGVASDFPSEYEAEAVIRTVDTALYRAKRSGRNCVIPAEIDLSLCEN
jgi:diguanylate cyclase